ncbi:L-cysteine desulfidase family protein [Dysosmobacter sp.]|uniref:L-cysteine desulfidase family protein n=1 Tax=Dysosmobacter sp. TaxID=2591382 RepID=UPI002A8E6D02|nr:L-serine ammonia-lyase, iron-sulfur-dependent, subunit alpha [Dysosmobacter sp.]MDY3985501.1 L-serine ammonia-lyase, iron-sulfur-dependent, subunit alpha [Dysosmobacter sp.]
MLKTDVNYKNCVKILEEELLPAMGCTEPIAVAYCAAVARKTLGVLPDRVLVEASGNIIKNVKSVVVPNTGHLRGIPAAAAAGIVAGDPDKQLEVIAEVSEAQQQEIKQYLESTEIKVQLAETPLIFDVIVTVYHGDSYAKVRIANYHTNIVLIEKDGQVLQSVEVSAEGEEGLTDRSFLSVELILDFANTVDIADVKGVLDTQISYNMAIAEEGLRNDYGANIGSVLLASHPEIVNANNEDALRLKARAMAAAGSDARMNGCELPVIINSGSGNQGITASVPVIVYARAMNVGEEKMYRALVLSNLLGVHQKTPIGRLSAYCGAISAGAAAGCGIAYLKDGSLDAIAHTLVNTLAISSGVICDGAKASCAGKIALAVDTGILGYEMYCQNQQFEDGDGIVKKGVENMIASVGRLGRDGMRETDKEILHIMVN